MNSCILKVLYSLLLFFVLLIPSYVRADVNYVTTVPFFIADNEIDIKPNLLDIDLNDPIINLNFNNNKSKNNESNTDTTLVPGEITNITTGQKGDITRVVFDVTKDFTTEVRILNFPFRLIFDLPMPYKWNVPQESLQEPALVKIVHSIRYGYIDDKVFRVVADLKSPVNIDRAFLVNLKDKGEDTDGAYKFIIDLKSTDSVTSLLTSSILVTPGDEAAYKSMQNNERNQELQQKELDSKRLLAINTWVNGYLNGVDYPIPILNKKSRPVVIAIDAGHGGKDPGAIAGEIKEKDITMDIARKLQVELEKNPEIAVVLIRRGDYYIPLKDRVLWAKKYNSDIFISIHADKAVDSSSSGLSIYTLSEKASDVQAQVIATNENKSDIIAGIDIGDEDSEVSRILISLLQRVKVNDSVILAKDILASVSENVQLLPNPLRSAGFVVLQVPETPSVLIETGFLSNTDDISRLSDANTQNLIASKISVGVTKYLWTAGKLKNMPAGLNITK